MYGVTPSIVDTITQRHLTHGDFSEVAIVAQGIKHYLRQGPNWGKMHAKNQESLDAIATKMARIVCGDEFEPDHWHDIQGYANLAAVGNR